MESGTHTRGYQIHLHSRVLWREHLLLASSSFSYFSLMACCLFIWMVFLSLAVCVCVWRDSTTHWLKRLFAYIYACNNPQMHRYREWMRLMNSQHSDHVSHWFLFDRMVRIHSHSKYSSNRLKNQQVYLHLDICVGRTRAHSNRPQRYVSSAVCFFGVILRFFFSSLLPPRTMRIGLVLCFRRTHTQITQNAHRIRRRRENHRRTSWDKTKMVVVAQNNI